jgi:diguanylate cyclase (GGDEF)-like protein
MMFGVPGLVALLASNLIIYNYSHSAYSQKLKSVLTSVASAISNDIEIIRLEKLDVETDPYYEELKNLLQKYKEAFGLSWVSLSQFTGTYFINIADAEDYYGDGYCYGHPVMDIPDELAQAWGSGTIALIDEYEDAYGFWMTAYVPVKNSDGKILAIVDASFNLDQLNRLKQNLLNRIYLLVGIFLLLMTVICFLSAALATRPLSELSLAASEIAGGNLNTRIPDLAGGIEVQTMVDSFNHMSEALNASQLSLKRKIFDLTTLFDISKEINFAANTSEISHAILERAMQSLSSARGSIFRYIDKDDILLLETATGENVTVPTPRIILKPGEGIAGKAFSTLETVVVKSFPFPGFKPYEDGVKSEIKNLICIPLVNEGTPVGVLNLVNSDEAKINDDNLHLANTMCAQMAMAMEKSRIYEIAITDGLTRLYNHRYFQIVLEKEVSRSRRYKSDLSLILFDVDHFKKFNDTYGHQLGDIVLKETGRLLKETLRDIDVVARYGGEEFTVIMPETDADGALLVAERLREIIAAHEYPGSDEPIHVNISLGIASCPTHAQEKGSLIEKADIALYNSKKNGRNQSSIYTDGMTM